MNGQRRRRRRRSTIDQVIDRANAQAARLLERLNLTAAEREAATHYAVDLIRNATKAMDAYAPSVGERVLPAAFAFALCWLEEAYQLTRSTNRRPRHPRKKRT
jgi:hypothetical protein